MESNNSLVAFVSTANLSKEAQGNLADSLVAQVTDGKVDAVAAFVQIKAIAEVCEQFLKNQAVSEAVQSAVVVRGKDAAFGGAKVGVSNSTRYDYASSGDPQYLDLIKQKDSIASQLKAREMFLKAITDEQDIVDRETGAIVTITPPAKTVSQSLRVTFDKA